jgi:hypothetical protein
MSAAHAYVVGTYNNIKLQWESYFLFCFYYNFIALPFSERILFLYAQFFSRSFKSIQNYISGVKLLHLFKGIDYPQFDSFHLRLVLKGLARDNPHCSNQACPITPEILSSFHQLLELNNAYDATIWCLFLTAFILMIRKSNLVPNSAKTFQSQKQLIRENIEFDSKNNVLIFHINWSKTIQYGERKLKFQLQLFLDLYYVLFERTSM